nr:MAG: hypothetical protein 1 [Hainan closterovirus 2]
MDCVLKSYLALLLVVSVLLCVLVTSFSLYVFIDNRSLRNQLHESNNSSFRSSSRLPTGAVSF